MDQISQIVEILAREKVVSFSFLGPGEEVQSVTIRECEEHDFDEYGEKYAPGSMFEVGPTHPSKPRFSTQFQFPDWTGQSSVDTQSPLCA